MNISKIGIDLIKKYEGCRLQAYLCPANVYTIGYGHTGPDVFSGKTITQPEADRLLKEDLKRFELYVEQYVKIPLNQSQFDALVSFTYNCGAGNLKTLISGRDHAGIAKALPLYNKGGGKALAGLVKRRAEEQALFLSTGTAPGASGNPYQEPKANVKNGSRGESVKWLQWQLVQCGYNVKIDGLFGTKTLEAVKAFQADRRLVVDGIVGVKTIQALKQ